MKSDKPVAAGVRSAQHIACAALLACGVKHDSAQRHYIDLNLVGGGHTRVVAEYPFIFAWHVRRKRDRDVLRLGASVQNDDEHFTGVAALEGPYILHVIPQQRVKVTGAERR